MSTADSSKDLTSTSEKQNALDAIPTSSTDANVSFTKNETVAEDPISSTSSEAYPAKCPEEEIEQFELIMGQSKSSHEPKPSVENEEEFFNMHMENVSSERITEDVEDIVQDLENLLGDSYVSPSKSDKREEKTDINVAFEELQELTKEDPVVASSDQIDDAETKPLDVCEEETENETVALSQEIKASNQEHEVHLVAEEPGNNSTVSSLSEAEEKIQLSEMVEGQKVVEAQEAPATQEVVTDKEMIEIHSTIREDKEPAASSKKSQKIRLIRSPIQFSHQSVTLDVEKKVEEVVAHKEVAVRKMEADKGTSEEISKHVNEETTAVAADVKEIIEEQSEVKGELFKEEHVNTNQVKCAIEDEGQSSKDEHLVANEAEHTNEKDSGIIEKEVEVEENQDTTEGEIVSGMEVEGGREIVEEKMTIVEKYELKEKNAVPRENDDETETVLNEMREEENQYVAKVESIVVREIPGVTEVVQEEMEVVENQGALDNIEVVKHKMEVNANQDAIENQSITASEDKDNKTVIEEEMKIEENQAATELEIAAKDVKYDREVIEKETEATVELSEQENQQVTEETCAEATEIDNDKQFVEKETEGLDKMTEEVQEGLIEDKIIDKVHISNSQQVQLPQNNTKQKFTDNEQLIIESLEDKIQDFAEDVIEGKLLSTSSDITQSILMPDSIQHGTDMETENSTETKEPVLEHENTITEEEEIIDTEIKELDEADPPILIDDPVVAADLDAESLTPIIARSPELPPTSVEDFNAENLESMVTETGDELIDELIETAALNAIPESSIGENMNSVNVEVGDDYSDSVVTESEVKMEVEEIAKDLQEGEISPMVGLVNFNECHQESIALDVKEGVFDEPVIPSKQVSDDVFEPSVDMPAISNKPEIIDSTVVDQSLQPALTESIIESPLMEGQGIIDSTVADRTMKPKLDEPITLPEMEAQQESVDSTVIDQNVKQNLTESVTELLEMENQPVTIDTTVVGQSLKPKLTESAANVLEIEGQPEMLDSAVVNENLIQITESSKIKHYSGTIDSTAVATDFNAALTEGGTLEFESQPETSYSTTVDQSTQPTLAVSIKESTSLESQPDTFGSSVVDQSLKATLTVDINDQEETDMYVNEESQKLVSPKAMKQESQHLLKITISKQPDNTHSILKVCTSSECENVDRIPKISIKPLPSPSESSSTKVSPKSARQLSGPSGVPKLTIKPIKPESPVKLTIKPIVKPEDIQEQKCSPKLTIKPIVKPDELYEPHRSRRLEEMHEQKSSPKLTIKPIVKPDDLFEQQRSRRSEEIQEQQKSSPKLTIKPIVKPDDLHEQQRSRRSEEIQEQKSSPKLTIKPIVKPDDVHEQHRSRRSEEIQEQKCSPKLTIKPIVKPDDIYEQQRSSPKLTIKPIIKPDEEHQKPGPKLHIKPILRSDDDCIEIVEPEEHRQARSSPKITIKPIVKPESEEGFKQRFSPKLTIKPIIKPDEVIDVEQYYHQKCSPKLTIKPIVKPEEEEQKLPKLTIKPIVRPEEQMHSPKITIKPIIRPQEIELNDDVVITSVKDCPKVTIKPVVKPAETTSQGVEIIDVDDDIRQERIILKINKKSTLPSRKREHPDDSEKGEKLAKIKVKYSKEGGHAHIVPQSMNTFVKHPHPEEGEIRKRFRLDDLNIPHGVTITNVEPGHSKLKEGLGSSHGYLDEVNIEPIERVDTTMFPVAHPMMDLESKDPLGDIPIIEIPDSEPSMDSPTPAPPVVSAPVVTPPRKRGRPRKVPLEVREEFKDPPKEEEEPVKVVEESTRPKRSCRGPSVKTTLGIKPRKPRGSGRGRGGKRVAESRPAVVKLEKETVTSTFAETEEPDVELLKETDVKAEVVPSTPENRDVPIYEEETRMSADAGGSRAQTPAKQVPTPLADVIVEESQSSVQSSATTESAKGRRGPRLEVHQEPEGAIISAEQLAEYSWGGGGPYMLQEQVAQFLGIKSFKRKYPGIQRRQVDMQERDFIRESGLASEAMCDLGLTAVNSADILDIMYSDFQPKYEEYCKHQRDRQAKDLTNKQKALTLAVSQEKNNLTEQAVQSAATWNSTFNKARREKRKACMDLQTFTIHYPKGKVKQINKPPVGNYPVALVPGQFTDYYKEFTPTELYNLPLNTLCYNTVNLTRNHEDDSQSDGSASDSDSSSTDSDSSESGSSEGENCTMCNTRSSQKQVAIH